MSPLDQLLAQSGWSPLDAESIEALQEDQRKAALEVASVYRRVFESADGQRLLKLWMAGTILKPTAHPRATELEVGIREGRCDFVRGILNQIHLARTAGQPQET